MRPELSIVSPVYNEGNNIEKLIIEIENKISVSKELLFIYDLENDNTLPPLRKIAKKNPSIKIVKNKYGRGVLNAIKTGFENVDSDAVLVTMADLSDDLSCVKKMIAEINGGADLVCGSRYMKGGSQKGGPFLKSLMSRIAGLSLHLLIRIPTHDPTNNFKMYSAKLLDSITIESTGGFEIGIELTVKAYVNGLKIVEFPTAWRDRTSGESNFKLIQWLPKYIKWYLWAIKKYYFTKK
ncbi:MAG: glycosyltransferase family 2 protein [Verrucomicrobiota bacterium]|nr:glycosyltransferase family 2 protein [Verrucomicrobiota bacterium]